MGSSTGATEAGGDADGHHFGQAEARSATHGEWEYRPVQLAGDVTRMTAAVRLAIQAEFGGWELSRVRLYPGGVRKVWLRRKRTAGMLPEPGI